MERQREGGRNIGVARVPNPPPNQEYRDNALGSRQALFIMGWTRVLEASGGSGPPKARVLWAPIGTGGVNRRAVSLRSVFAHEPRVVFRDNKRATSSSAGTTTPRFLSFFFFFFFFFFCSLLFRFSVSRSFPSILASSLVFAFRERLMIFLQVLSW